MADITINTETLAALRNQLGEPQNRAVALEAVLSRAADVGVESAINEFGSNLGDAEKKLLRSLSREELVSLKKIQDKLGPLASRGDNNNNNL